MSDLPLCETCGGTGELFEDSMSVVGIPGGQIAVGPCPAGCVAVLRSVWDKVGAGKKRVVVTECLDPAEVILICETHRSTLTDRGIGGRRRANRLLCQARFIDPTASPDPCDIKVRILGPVYGEPA